MSKFFELKDDARTSIWIDTDKVVAIIIPSQFSVIKEVVPGVANIHCGLPMPVVVRDKEALRLLKFLNGVVEDENPNSPFRN